MSLKNIILFIIGTIGVMALSVLLLWQFGSNAAKPIADIAGERLHIKGSGKVEIVEFSDFQCPACAIAQPELKKLVEQYQDKITLVFRHLPLTTIHPYAMVAAQAAVAAQEQGKFWEMHDILFERQTDWVKDEPRKMFLEYARELGLDEVKFAMDLESQEVKDKINTDVVAATRHRINGTPTFYVNGVETPLDQIEGKITELGK